MSSSDVDETVSRWTETLARKISRRRIVSTGLKGIAATAAAWTIGNFAAGQSAEAVSCSCSYPGCGSCSCLGKTCPTSGCPSGCYVCTTSSGCGGMLAATGSMRSGLVAGALAGMAHGMARGWGVAKALRTRAACSPAEALVLAELRWRVADGLALLVASGAVVGSMLPT